jgi:glycolate dehydrogenase FAD-linked subunit
MVKRPKNRIIRELQAAIGPENVLFDKSDLLVYECDGFTIETGLPDAVVFPNSTEAVARVVKLAHQHKIPLIARGAGTSLAGGCVPITGGIVLMLTRMNRIERVDTTNRMALVEAGVPNLQLERALSGTGFHFAPDPSSQKASTIGGNVATNAGGPHTLKYGVTLNHVLGLEAVLGDGTILNVDPIEDPGELDLVGLLVGSEGTLAIITKIWVRLTSNPIDYRTMRVTFETAENATSAISQIIAEGIIPAAMELMDQGIIAAVEDAFKMGFPLDAGAIVVIEIDGPTAGLDQQQNRIIEICKKHKAREVLGAADAAEREKLWQCRKMAVGAVGRLSPTYLIQDGVVPRTRLPELLAKITQISAKHKIRIVNVAHAGDGNLHPILLLDQREEDQVKRTLAAGDEILEACLAAGGSLTAEHGIGIEKIKFMEKYFSPVSLDLQRELRNLFAGGGKLNPGKLIPA